MNFSRTKSGISSYHNFYNVEYLVFSEGGKPPVTDESNINWSIDSIFWRAVFEKFSPGIRVKIKSMGSKANVKPYAEKIQRNEISNSIAVFDRDYDPYRGETITHPRVLYTYGYSWENDACQADLLIQALSKIHPNGHLSENDETDIRTRFDFFLKSINRMVFVDLLCGLKKIKGVDRENYWSLIDTSDPKLYKLRKRQFLSLIQSIKTRRASPLRYLGNNRISAHNDCYGKIISRFCYTLYCEYYKKITKQNSIPAHFLERAMAEAIEHADLRNIPELEAHYSSAVLGAVS